MKSKLVKILGLAILLFLANLYLLRPGLWTFQDASYWPNTYREAYMFLNQPLQAFSNYGYYLGFENGLFVYTRIGVSVTIFILFNIFGPDGSQAMFSILGNLGAFLSFYLFSGLFFKKSNLRYVLSLVYTFHPLVFQLQGHTYFAIAIPLYIYSYYRFIQGGKKKGIYLLLNLVAVFIWIAYVRFIQGFAIVIIPYLIYIWYKSGFNRKFVAETIKLGIIYCLVLSPTLVAIYFQITGGSGSILNYASVYGNSIAKTNLLDSVNILYSQIIPVYKEWWFTIAGMLIFTWFVGLLAKYSHIKRTRLLILNMALLLLGVFLYNIGNILSQDSYFKFLTVVPFIVNSPVFALYVTLVPFVTILGIIGSINYKRVRLFSLVLVAFSIHGYLNFNRQELTQLNIRLIPKPYAQLWPANKTLIPYSTLYYPNPCWPANYQFELKVSKPCLNYGLYFSSMKYDDPRMADTKTLSLAGKKVDTETLRRLRVTHNLKAIVIPNDFIGSKLQAKNITEFRDIVESSGDYIKHDNDNFSLYINTKSIDFDYFTYSPTTTKLDNLTLSSGIDMPVVSEQVFDSQNVNIFYKYSPDYPERILLKIGNYDKSKTLPIQLNQTFSKYWKLTKSDIRTFENVKCLDHASFFYNTNNSVCRVSLYPLSASPQIEVKATKSLSNYLGLLWILDKQETTSKQRFDDLYLEFRYIPKTYIEYAVIVSIFTLLVTLVYSIKVLKYDN